MILELGFGSTMVIGGAVQLRRAWQELALCRAVAARHRYALSHDESNDDEVCVTGVARRLDKVITQPEGECLVFGFPGASGVAVPWAIETRGALIPVIANDVWLLGVAPPTAIDPTCKRMLRPGDRVTLVGKVGSEVDPAGKSATYRDEPRRRILCSRDHHEPMIIVAGELPIVERHLRAGVRSQLRSAAIGAAITSIGLFQLFATT